MRHTRYILQTIVLAVALLAAGQTAMAETVTYTISGHKEPTTSYLTIDASGSATGTANDSWDITSTSARTVTLPGGITFNFGSDKTTSLAVEDDILTIRANGSTGGYITLSGSNYVYHVILKDKDGGIIHEDWNMTDSYTYRFQAIFVKTIVVEYATAIPITDAVITGVDNSYVVSDTPVKPIPTVTWHGTTLTKGTHYTLNYQNADAAGTATVRATGKGIFSTSTSVSKNYNLVWATYSVHFDRNSDIARGSMNDQAFTYNTAQALTANAFTAPTGYIFAGWNTAANGSGDSFTDGQNVSKLTATDGATVTLYAQWTDLWGISSGANGAQALPYVITSPAGLDYLASIVNGTDGYAANDFSGKFFKLGADIAYDPNTPNNYTAIGENLLKSFCGSFDGDGYTVSGIRINGNNQDQGLFGYVSGSGTIQNVILNNARITGQNQLGGITGEISSFSEYTIKNCFVLNTAIITSLDGANDVGVIFGSVGSSNILNSNYYYNCTLTKGENTSATNIGANNSDCDGARGVYTITLTDGVTAAGESVEINNTAYFAAGTTVTLSYSGTDGIFVRDANNNSIPVTVVGGSVCTFTMPASNVTVSIGVLISYIDDKGAEQTCIDYTILTGEESTIGVDNETKWYVVSNDISFDHQITIYGDVRLILSDGKTMTVTVTAENESGIKMNGNSDDLTIYGQSSDTGSLEVTGTYSGIYVNIFTVNGGNVTATGIYVFSDVTVNGGNLSATGANNGIGSDTFTINGGNVTATGDLYGIQGNYITINGGAVTATGGDGIGISAVTSITINGGAVTATGNKCGIKGRSIILGWTNTSDSITASKYSSNNQITINRNQSFTDGTTIYSGSVNTSDISDNPLRPYLNPGSADSVTLTQGSKDGVTAWWGTFFYGGKNYVLSEGATAYTLGSDYKLYRLGVDGRTIPKRTAVVIIATKATIQYYNIGNGTLTVTDHAPGGNILQGSNSAVAVTGLSGTPYVLSVDTNGIIGFREYTGTDDIPAYKAYYVQ